MMKTDIAIHQDYERTLIEIVRILPPNRVEQLVDFARFLRVQIQSKDLVQEADLVEIESENAEWDVLMATDEAQTLLETLADEALAEHRAGRTRPMVFSQGRIAPG